MASRFDILASKIHVFGPTLVLAAHGSNFDRFPEPPNLQKPIKTIVKSMFLQYCTVQLQIQKNSFLDRFGTPNPPKLGPRCLQVPPRWCPKRSPEPQDGCPNGLRALQTAIQVAQDTSLEVSGHSRPRFGPPRDHLASNLGVPGLLFECPGINFPAPQAPVSQYCKSGLAECAERLNKI